MTITWFEIFSIIGASVFSVIFALFVSKIISPGGEPLPTFENPPPPPPPKPEINIHTSDDREIAIKIFHKYSKDIVISQTYGILAMVEYGNIIREQRNEELKKEIAERIRCQYPSAPERYHDSLIVKEFKDRGL